MGSASRDRPGWIGRIWIDRVWSSHHERHIGRDKHPDAEVEPVFPAASPMIHLAGIQVTVPNGRELFRIDELHIPTGTHLLVRGDSGQGKTTLLHLIAGLFSPARGEVTIGSTRLSSLSEDRRCQLRLQKIGLVFQKFNLIDHLTVSENVSLALQPNVAARSDRIRNALERVSLRGCEPERCAHLSAGEQQRVAVARVLAQAPEIILADEPSSSLDRRNADFVMEALKEAAGGRTLVVVSHDDRITSFFEQVVSFRDLVA